jgi:hypothetical protein
VTLVSAPSSATASGRALAIKLSPTHSESKIGFLSAAPAKSSISDQVVAPNKVARCGIVKPNFIPPLYQ